MVSSCDYVAGAVIAVPAPIFYVTLNAELCGGIVMLKTGLGDHNFEIDITRAVSELGVLTGVTADVLHRKTEDSTSYYAGATINAAKLTDESTHLYTADVDGDTHTYLSFWHRIERRGEHRITLTFGFGTNGRTITTTDAIVLLSGDGKLEDF